MSERLFAFVLMPFGSEFDDVYRLGIKDTAEAMGVIAERVDEQTFSETILERIYRQIESCDFVIADMTGRNPNVFYEVGYAHAKRKLVTLITKHASDIPFDLKHHRHLVYGDKITDLRSKLSVEIEWIKAEIDRSRVVPITISHNEPWGSLAKTKRYHNATVYFQFDLHNRTNIKSPDIDAIYLHTGPGWRLKQGGNDCPSTESQVGNYSLRHFIQASVTRLSPGAWCQIKIMAEKLLWYQLGKDPPQDAYTLAGNVLLDISTSEGSFIEEIPLNVLVDEMPF